MEEREVGQRRSKGEESRPLVEVEGEKGGEGEVLLKKIFDKVWCKEWTLLEHYKGGFRWRFKFMVSSYHKFCGDSLELEVGW